MAIYDGGDSESRDLCAILKSGNQYEIMIKD